jgi:hypothetical protein
MDQNLQITRKKRDFFVKFDLITLFLLKSTGIVYNGLKAQKAKRKMPRK